MKKSIKKFEVKEIRNLTSLKGGANGKGTKKATDQVKQNTNTFDLL